VSRADNDCIVLAGHERLAWRTETRRHSRGSRLRRSGSDDDVRGPSAGCNTPSNWQRADGATSSRNPNGRRSGGPGREAGRRGWHQRYGEAHAEVHAPTRGENAPAAQHSMSRSNRAAITARRLPVRMPHPARRHQPCRGCDAGPISTCERTPGRQPSCRGVTVEFGIGEDESRRLNAPYLTLLGKGRPYILSNGR